MRSRRALHADDLSFVRSAFASQGQFQTIDEFLAWFRSRCEAHAYSVRRIPFSELDAWQFASDPCRLVHQSGRFFTVEGIRVRTDYGPVREWDQPIIRQPEIGILGIITRVSAGVREFLMQVKMEPGNVNLVQLAPTVQATKSNYTRVHRGKLPLYFEYFATSKESRILVDQLQPEQGARFLRKRNRNMIVEVAGDLPVHDDFCWLTIRQLKALLRHDNLINMDARTVLSCIPFTQTAPAPVHSTTNLDGTAKIDGHRLEGYGRDIFMSMVGGGSSVCTTNEIMGFLSMWKATVDLTVEPLPLDALRRWIVTDRDIRHETGRYFSVIAVDVRAGSREVFSWTQPLLAHEGFGLVGFLTQRIEGVLHFLVRAAVQPGSPDTVDLGPTVACSCPDWAIDQPSPPRFLDRFLEAPPEQVRYSAIQSEEGGRFYHFQNRYMILELPQESRLTVPDGFIWMTLNQIVEFARHGHFNIEGRNLLSCLDFASE